MTPTAYIVSVLAALVMLGVVIELLRRRRLRERHALWWLLVTLLAVVAGVFPGLLAGLAQLLGFELPANLVFFVSIGILVFVCIQQSSELTVLEDKTRALAEKTALLELRLAQIERDDRGESGD